MTRRNSSAVDELTTNPFKRGVTLTGSSSADISSVSAKAESNSAIISPRAKAHQLAYRRRKLRFALFISVLILAVCGFLLQQYTVTGFFNAQSDSSIQLSSEYETSLMSYYAARPVERFRFALNKVSLSSYMSQRHPEIKEIQLDGSGGIGVTRFILSLRSPVAVWSIGDNLRYVDSDGKTFTKNYFKTPSVKIIDSYGDRQSNGSVVTSNRFLSIVGQVVGMSKKVELVVERVEIPPTTTRQIAVYIKGRSYPTRMTIDRPVNEQVSDMSQSIAWMDINYPKPEYIDVRVPGRAFYK